MTTHQPRRMLRCSSAAVLLLLVLLLLSFTNVYVCAEAAAADPTTASVNASVWLSGPASVWEIHHSYLQAPLAVDLLAAVLASPFATPNTNVFVSSIMPYTNTTASPATGAMVTFMVSNSTLTATSSLTRLVQTSAFASLNAVLADAAGNYTLAVRPIPVVHPDTMTLVVDTLLPLAGSSYGWQVLLSVLAGMTADRQSVLLYELQTDLQDAVDPTMSSYIAVVPTDLTQSFANASSFYLSYSVWQAASTRAAIETLGEADLADTLRSRVMASQLPAFNKAFNTLASTNDKLANNRDLFPPVITPRNALVVDVDSNGGGGGSGSSDDMVLREEVGEYLLVFAGDAATWGRVWAAQPAVVGAAVVSAAQPRLSQRTSHNVISVLSATTIANEKRYVGGLQVRCRVVQGVTRLTENVWDPEQVVSLLRQVNYTAMEALYTAAIRSAMTADAHREPDHGAIATTAIVYDFSYVMQLNVVGIICMSAIIVVGCVTMALVAVGFVCCCPHMLRLCFPDDGDDSDRQHAFSESDETSLRDLAALMTMMGKGRTWSAGTTAEAASVSQRGMRNPLDRKGASHRGSMDVSRSCNSSRRSSVTSARSLSRRESVYSSTSGSPSMNRKVATIPAQFMGRRESVMSQSWTKEKTATMKRSASMSYSALSQHSASSKASSFRASAQRRTLSVDQMDKPMPVVQARLQQYPQHSSRALPPSANSRRSVSCSPPIKRKDFPTAAEQTSVVEEVNAWMPKAVIEEEETVVMAFTQADAPWRQSEASVRAVQLPPWLTEKQSAAAATIAATSTAAGTTATSPSTGINTVPLPVATTVTSVKNWGERAEEDHENSSSSDEEDSDCPSIVTAASLQCGAPATFRPTQTSPPPVLPKSDADEFYMFTVDDEDGQTEAAWGRHVSVIPHIPTSPIEAPMLPASSLPPAPTTSELTAAAPPHPVAAYPPVMAQNLLRAGSMGFSQINSQMAPLMFNHQGFQQQQQHQQQQCQQLHQPSFYSNPNRASCPANTYAPPLQQHASPVMHFLQPTTSAPIPPEQRSLYQRSLAGADALQDASPPPSLTRRRSVSFTKNALQF